MRALDLRRGGTRTDGGVRGAPHFGRFVGTRRGEKASPRMRNRAIRRRVPLLLAALAVALVSVAPAGSAPPTPTPTGPADGTVVDSLPVFAWNHVAGADKYEFEIAADPGFNAPVLGAGKDNFFTKNTRATIEKVVPNGTYWWHVRAVAGDGSVSGWSTGLSVTKNWAAAPTLSSPANGATVTFPTDAFQLSWNPVPGATEYSVSLATDPTLGSVIWSTGPVRTGAPSFTLSSPLAPKTYYWGVTPLDAAGNPGTPSPVWSFTWVWPSTTTPTVVDIASATEIYDHEFRWNPVPGAVGYEVEVNKSVDFAPGSRVCCPVSFLSGVTSISTSYTPEVVLENNNQYFWRVRAIDPTKNAGAWNVGPQFSKSFNNVVPTVRNLRMVDNPSPAEGAFETSVPIVAWDPVPGASAYEVEVTVYTSGCDWTSRERWRSTTATTAWTPLGGGWNGSKPYSSTLNVSFDFLRPVPGHAYCVRVTALDRPSDVISPYVRSVERYLPSSAEPAFVYTGPAAGGPCSACQPASLGANDYVLPLRGTTTTRMPYFRWNHIAGYGSYYVLVSKDPDFTNLVDYAFTQVNAYAPRATLGARTYPDETNLYYWAVLPATGEDGGGVFTAPQFSAPATFHKQSLPPGIIGPSDGTVFSGPARFHWSPVEAARRYRLQVARDATFATANILEDVTTDSTAYTAERTYDADTDIYWRVRADDESGTGLTWSSTRVVRKSLPAPVPDPLNPMIGDLIPTWKWALVPGAVSYDVEVTLPNGTPNLFTRLPSRAFTFTGMRGPGIWKWRARANFPQVDRLELTQGPWSPRSDFTRTIREPANPNEEFGERRLVFRWDTKLGAVNYRVQISTRPDFAIPFDTATTDIPRWSSRLTQPPYTTGGTFYWRVAAADHSVLNAGDYTAARSFTLPAIPATPITVAPPTTQTTLKLIRMGARGYPVKGRFRAITIRVKDRATLQPIAGARVRVSGSGVRPRTKTTGVGGSVRFVIKATRLGRVAFRATKAGYQTAYLYRQVRRR